MLHKIISNGGWMNLAEVNNNSSPQDIDEVLPTRQTRPKVVSGTIIGIGTSQRDSAGFSKPAVFFNRLAQLKTEYPEKFKELFTEIADRLENASENSSLGTDKAIVNNLADKFREVANSGDLSSLLPPELPPLPGGRQSIQQYQFQNQQSLSDVMISGQSQMNLNSQVVKLFKSIFEGTDSN